VAKKKKQPVFSTTDLWGNLVILQEETWLNHIVEPIDGHPEMTGYENLVKQVVVDPYEAYQSTQQSTGILFLSDPHVGPRPEGIRVVVNYSDTSYEKGATSGFVVTAYPIDLVLYPSPKIGKLIYKRGR
jgi:hypothetical protein